MDADTKFMREALKQAKKAFALNETPIGCVIVREGRIIARGYNRRNTDHNTLAHAELTAIRKAEEDSDSRKREAKLEARKMVEQAKAEAEKIISDAEDEGNKTYNSLIQEGMNEADQEYDEAMEQARVDAKEMAEKAETKKDKVIDYIVERIVRSGVDS